MNDKQIKDIFTKYTYILVDTREKKNNHIIEKFEEHHIKYIKTSLSYGDYGIMIKANEEYGFEEDIIFKVAVERKRDLNEIGTNLTTAHKRFSNEMQRCVDDGGTMIIAIENNDYGDIAKGNYKNKIDKKAFYGLLHSIYNKYNVPFIFIPDDKDMALFIYNWLKYYVRRYLKTI